MNNYNVIGLMSGTSLDGLDIAYCSFILNNNSWQYKILKAKTVEYSAEWLEKLKTIHNKSAFELVSADIEYGKYIGKFVKEFIDENNINVDFICSHGHTIFHQPQKGITYQLGNGNNIKAVTGVSVINDYRTYDVAIGGQGAPLVPIGDELLFANYNYCINLGGFANISYNKDGKRIAFDICPVNIALNYLTNKIGEKFDNNGSYASKGKLNTELLNELNKIQFYSEKPPKSLGREWLEKVFIPIIEKYDISINDKLNTICEHIAIQITNIINKDKLGTVLVTGGGAYNSFLISLLKNKTNNEIIIPDKSTIDYKEALIFAFLGILKIRNEINCLSSVTGAKKDNIGGIIC